MADTSTTSNGRSRVQEYIAIGILIFSVLAITVLAIVAILNQEKNGDTMTILNMVLPVFASWVGTIIAFYFGRENFESANRQVRELVEKVNPEQRAKAIVVSVMRRFADMVIFTIPTGKSEADIPISELRDKFGGSISRLPVVDSNSHPKYMIHRSAIDNYIASNGKDTDTLEVFLKTQKDNRQFEYGVNKGFVLVSEEATLELAKRKMEQYSTCQDIFITQGGSDGEALTGWISNVRLSKFLEAN